MPNKGEQITPHKGGRTETRLVQMTPKTKRMLEEVLRMLSELEGKKISYSDWLESRIAVVYNYLLEQRSSPPLTRTVPGETGLQGRKLPPMPDQTLLMTDEVRLLTDYVLDELRKRSGEEDIDISDVWENRIRYLYKWLHDNPNLPPEYMGQIRTRTMTTGALQPLPPVERAKKAPPDASSD